MLGLCLGVLTAEIMFQYIFCVKYPLNLAEQETGQNGKGMRRDHRQRKKKECASSFMTERMTKH